MQMRARSSMVVIGLALLSGACSDAASIIIEPLRIVNWSPSGGGFCIDVNARVVATFSDDLEADAINATETFALRDADGVVAAETAYSTGSPSTASIPWSPPATSAASSRAA
jgi:hypothetical protein